MTEAQLMEWLSKEPTSALGECKGRVLDTLVEKGFASILNPDAGDWARVRLTEEGFKRIDPRNCFNCGEPLYEAPNGNTGCMSCNPPGYGARY